MTESLKGLLRDFVNEDWYDGAIDSATLGGVVRGADVTTRTVGDYCRDWLECDDRMRDGLYLEGRPHFLGLSPVETAIRFYHWWGDIATWNPTKLNLFYRCHEEHEWDPPYWPSLAASCPYVGPAWYGKRQRRVSFWNPTFDMNWLNLAGCYGNNKYLTHQKLMERMSDRGRPDPLGAFQVSEPDSTKEVYTRWSVEDHAGK